MAVGVLRGGGDVNASLVIDNVPPGSVRRRSCAFWVLCSKVPNEVFCLCLMIEYILKHPLADPPALRKWIHDITRIE